MEESARFRGCLIGLACGDALGVATQFQHPGRFSAVNEMIGGGTFGLLAGQWSDDTSMALCLATSLCECGAFDPKDQLTRYVRWWRTGYLSCTGKCYDIGGTTSAALSLFVKTQQPFCGVNRPYSAGNGSLVRVAPVALFSAHNPQQALHLAVESCRTTHGLRINFDAARYLVAILLGFLHDVPKDVVLAPDYEPFAGAFTTSPLCKEIEELRQGSFRQKSPPEIRAKGYVAESLEAALWALARSSDFREGALAAINLGHDATSVGALYGQMAGALYGIAGIPEAWKKILANRTQLEETADKLLALAQKA